MKKLNKMESINKIIELAHIQLNLLLEKVSGKKDEIEKEYKQAINMADATKKEALKEFAKDDLEIAKLKELIKSYSSVKPKVHPPVKPEKVNSPGFNIVGKISYALTQIGSGYKEDIAKEIAKEDGTNVDATTRKISGVLSTLKKNGQINSTKDGRKDKYSLLK